MKRQWIQNYYKSVMLIILTSTILLSCSSTMNVKENESFLLGYWKQYDGPLYYNSPDDNTTQYTSLNPNILYYFSDSKNVNLNLTNITEYKFVDSTLLILNKTKSTWFNKFWDIHKIIKLTKDTLILATDLNIKQFLLKQNIKDDNSKDVKMLYMSTTGCFGPCLVFDVLITSEGNIIINAKDHLNQKGICASKISVKDFIVIKSLFKQFEILKLKNDYSYGADDEPSQYLILFSNENILKEINIDGGSSPFGLSQSIDYIYKLVNDLEFDKIKVDKFPYLIYNRIIGFNNEFKSMNLRESEKLILLNYLYNGKIIDINFKPLYILNTNCDETENKYKYEKIETDGRYYKFFQANKDPITIDIGTDFLKYMNTNNK